MLDLILAAMIAATDPLPTEEPTPPAPALECPAGTAPGWLDESGLPTSCVGDDPCPETEEPDCPEAPAPTVPTHPSEESPGVPLPRTFPKPLPLTPVEHVDELAYTAVDPFAIGAASAAGGILVGLGAGLILVARRRSRP